MNEVERGQRLGAALALLCRFGASAAYSAWTGVLWAKFPEALNMASK